MIAVMVTPRPPTFDPDVATSHLRAADPRLGALLDHVGACGLVIQPEVSTFAALAKSIVYQQLTGKAAATIFGRVCTASRGRSDRAPTPAAILALADEPLRAAGLSRSKLLALRDLAARSEAGEIPTLAKLRVMPDDAIIESLTRVRGIGRWSVEMLLMFRLGRPDILPVGDYGVRKGFARTFRMRALPTPIQLARRGAKWSPYRSVASWYLWRATELPAAVRIG